MRDRFKTTAAFATIAAVSTALSGAAALAQPGGGMSTPLVVDLKKVPVGSWAEYQVMMGDSPAKARWSLVNRGPENVTVEMAMEGGPAAAAGGKMTVKLVLAPDPTKAERPVQQMVMQIEGKDPMEMPSQAPTQRFEKPDPKKLVGKETVKVVAGSIATSHYRDTNERGTIDLWVSDKVPPLGLVKMAVTPKSGSMQPPMKMELSAQGKDAKPTVTKTATPFDPAAFMGARGQHPGGGAPPSGGPPPPAPPK